MKKFKLNQELVQKLVAIVVVFTIIIANYAISGTSIVKAVAEELETQSKIEKGENVNFYAYFEQEQGGTTYQKNLNIEETQNLIVQIEVKDKFAVPNATIKFEDANFKINVEKLKELDNRYITNVNEEANEITVSSISSNTTAKLEIPIDFKKQEEIKTDYLEKEVNVVLEGNYVDINQNERELKGSATIKPTWTKETTEINVAQSIEKYFSLGGNGTLLQQLIKTNVVNEVLPRNEETVEVQAPVINGEKPQEVKALIDGERVADEEVMYNQQSGTITLRSKNVETAENNIKWDAKEKQYTLLYHYASTAPVQETRNNIKCKSRN